MNMSFLFVTLDMSKLSSWLNAVAYCRVERRPHATREECGPGGVKALGGGNASGMHGKGPTQAAGARARAERTENIQLMSVTLDVSKLSGWLKASAPCRVKTRARNVGRGTAREGEGAGCRVAATQPRHAQGGPDSRLWARARAERTRNIRLMSVTLDVSKLSGWLKAFASCRVERRACNVGRGTAREG